MHVCVRVCVRVCGVRVRVYVCLCLFMNVCLYVNVYLDMHVYIGVHSHKCDLCMPAFGCEHTCTLFSSVTTLDTDTRRVLQGHGPLVIILIGRVKLDQCLDT